ncbi:MAG: nitroreductase family protein [Paraclostridium sp.]
MELYDAIFYRKSIKKYSKSRVSINMFEEIQNVCEDIDLLNKDINVKAHPILKGDSLKFIIKKKSRIVAPHYILITSEIPEESDGYLENVGFVGEKIVLKLTELGLANCWVGEDFDKNSINDFVHLEEGEEPIALIAFGFPDSKEKLFRSNDEKIDRKSLKDIAKNVDENWLKIIECVRLAPSYKNSQPWRFYKDNNFLNIYRKKVSYETLSKIDMGIALRHFEIACKYYGIDFEYSKIEAKKRLKREYYISVK